jgi:hypothetical protein
MNVIKFSFGIILFLFSISSLHAETKVNAEEVQQIITDTLLSGKVTPNTIETIATVLGDAGKAKDFLTEIAGHSLNFYNDAFSEDEFLQIISNYEVAKYFKDQSFQKFISTDGTDNPLLAALGTTSIWRNVKFQTITMNPLGSIMRQAEPRRNSLSGSIQNKFTETRKVVEAVMSELEKENPDMNYIFFGYKEECAKYGINVVSPQFATEGNMTSLIKNCLLKNVMSLSMFRLIRKEMFDDAGIKSFLEISNSAKSKNLDHGNAQERMLYLNKLLWFTSFAVLVSAGVESEIKNHIVNDNGQLTDRMVLLNRPLHFKSGSVSLKDLILHFNAEFMIEFEYEQHELGQHIVLNLAGINFLEKYMLPEMGQMLPLMKSYVQQEDGTGVNHKIASACQVLMGALRSINP